MYFIQYETLKTKLKQRNLPDREAFPYLMAYAILTALAVGFPMSENYNQIDMAGGFVSVILAIWGVSYAYKKNGKENGYDFIQKYTVLGWIAFIRCTLVFIPAYIVLLIFGEVTGLADIDAEETSWFDFTIYAFFEALIYHRIGRHITDTTENGANRVDGSINSPVPHITGHTGP